MTLLQAIILAIVEGLTEFLPVSSTGHMVLTSSLMGIASKDFTKTFTIAIQFGAILSVVILYFKKFIPEKGKLDFFFSFYKKLLIAFIPALVFGFLFKKQIDLLLENVIVVACALLIGGIIFLLLGKWMNEKDDQRSPGLPTDKKSFRIGMFQVISMIPGVSRSAATIIGGLSQGLNKKAAAEFSFFLAVPTMFAATVKGLYDFYKDGGGFHGNEVQLLIVGNVVAFIVALIAIKTFITYLGKHGFRIFGYYRIFIGLLILILHFVGIELTLL